jgi:hypothetical protein
MLRFTVKKQNFFASVIFLFLLIYSNQVIASRVVAVFNAADATGGLQGAINSAKDTVVVPFMGAGTEWIVTPIKCASNRTIIFEKGVIVTAKTGAFIGTNDCLFRIDNVSNVSLIGYGATFRMQKADYMKSPYVTEQWRHGIMITGSSGIKILGLTVKETGGDGVDLIYGASNILIKDVICDNNYRQGMSVEDNANVIIENCVMINTGQSGKFPNGPWAGIDFEPFLPDENKMTNIKITNCYTGNNFGGGIEMALGQLNSASTPVDIQIKQCYVYDGITDVICNDNRVKGTVSYEDCITECQINLGFLDVNPNKFGYYSRGKSGINSYLTKFTNCQWQNCNPAIGFLVYSAATALGGLQFVNCTINEPNNASVIRRGEAAVANITGNIKVNCPYGAMSALGAGTNVTLQCTTGIKSNPPKIALVKPDKGVPAKVINYTAGEAINISAAAYDPDIGFTDGSGIKKVDFALCRSNNAVGAAVASSSDILAPFAWPITTSTKCPRGIYMIRITAYSTDGSYTVAAVPIYIYNTVDGTGPYVTGSGIEFNHEAINFIPEKYFLVRTAFQGFRVYSPFSTDSKITISDLSGRQVTLAQTVKAKSWNNISTKNKLSKSVYFIKTSDEKGNSSIVKKAMIAK